MSKDGRTWDVCKGGLFDGEIIDTCQCVVSIVHGSMIIPGVLPPKMMG